MLSFYQILWIFAIYAFLGWGSEVIYAAADTGKFSNRGFLNGPFCPVYGLGVLFVVLCLTPVKENLALLFLGSVLLASLLEFITGFILEKFFDDKWWDYSAEPFNIKGYVCLKFSLAWGVACLLVVNTVQPVILHFVDWMPKILGIILLTAIFATVLADAAITTAAAIGMKRRLTLMNELGSRLKALSNTLGEPLADGVLDVKEKFDEGLQELGEKLDEGMQELEEIKERLKTLSEHYGFNQKRLIKSFPRLKNGKYKENIERIIRHQIDRFM